MDSKLKREVFESFHEMIRLAIAGEKYKCSDWGNLYKQSESVTKAIEVLDKLRKEF